MKVSADRIVKIRYWLTEPLEDAIDRWVTRPIMDHVLPRICAHEPVMDHCGIPEHDLCRACQKVMPHQAVSERAARARFLAQAAGESDV